MPIYEYRCQDCGHEFERMQKFSDPPIALCPTCAGSVQKLISRSAFHLKGSGWYVTDYGRNGGQKDESSSEKSEKSVTEKTTGEKSTSEKSGGKDAAASASSGSGSESTKKSTSGTAAA